MTKLTFEQVEALTTPRLLAYYKKYGHSWVSKYYCGCCGDFLCEHSYNKEDSLAYTTEFTYWSKVKEILSTREHVHKK